MIQIFNHKKLKISVLINSFTTDQICFLQMASTIYITKDSQKQRNPFREEKCINGQWYYKSTGTCNESQANYEGCWFPFYGKTEQNVYIKFPPPNYQFRSFKKITLPKKFERKLLKSIACGTRKQTHNFIDRFHDLEQMKVSISLNDWRNVKISSMYDVPKLESYIKDDIYQMVLLQ